MIFHTIDEYINSVERGRKDAFIKIRNIIKKNIPEGFTEELNYNMPGFVVPLSIYPNGYLGRKDTPLPFINLASQKNYLALYHMALYAKEDLYTWFMQEYADKGYPHKIDIGKSCIRFKYLDEIPYDLIEKLVRKISVKEWITIYEQMSMKKN